MPKRRCPNGLKHKVIKWGENKSGTNRFKCLTCGISFTPKRNDVYLRNRFIWFELWLKGSSISVISRFSGLKQKTVRRLIHWYLDHPPKPKPRINKNCRMVIDATWFKREHCFIVYWDTNLQIVQYWRYTTSENSLEIYQDLIKLKEKQVICSSITSDGSRGVIRAVSLTYLDIPHQRCVTHVQRHGLRLLTKNPKTQPGKELKPLIQVLSQVQTKEQKDNWIKAVLKWNQRWDEFLKERSYFYQTNRWWYTHKSLRRARALLINALPNLFYYLNDISIPKTSNGLEGRFSALKFHYAQHRGLSKQRRSAYLAWYLTVVINGEKPTRFVH